MKTAWQSIETAPKEANEILLYGGSIQIGAWEKTENRFMADCEHYVEIEDFRPTHWMPLPKAPTEPVQQGKSND